MTRILAEQWPRVLPGKQPVHVRPEVAKRLRRAEQIHGGPIYPTGSLSGGRTYAQQKALRELYLAGKGPVASDPDTGPVPHLKFIGFDVAPVSYGAIPAMKKAGFVFTTPSEKWHAEEPNARGWPVVTSFYTSEEDDMALSQEDIDKIARAVWREQLAHAGETSSTNAGTHLTFGRRDANAAAARAEEAVVAAGKAQAAAEAALAAVNAVVLPSVPAPAVFEGTFVATAKS